MTDPYPVTRRKQSEELITGNVSDILARHHAVFNIRALAESDPGVIVPETVSALRYLMQKPEYFQTRQGFFLLRNTAEALGAIMVHCRKTSVGRHAYSSLIQIIKTSSGHARRTAAEALGSLPITIEGPEAQFPKTCHIPCGSCDELLMENRLSLSGQPVFIGRSLVSRMKNSRKYFVVKLARSSDTPEKLADEIHWMRLLRSRNDSCPVRFDIPEPVYFQGAPVFRLKKLDVPFPETLHPRGYAISFLAHEEYFVYPNGGNGNGLPSHLKFREMLERAAMLLGCLASKGIIHTAVIPLFHNRVQRNRRRDAGRYEWFRGGRLDQWLHSCQWPNIGATGLRDFEHFISFTGPSKHLYRHIGDQVLSLLLIAGSYFRAVTPEKKGIDEDGRPVDVRHLFDQSLLRSIVENLFHGYYEGFTGNRFHEVIPFDFDLLVTRMVDEMGMDRYMEEILRAADQDQMSRAEFEAFLSEKGVSDEKIQKIRKGEEDISLLTGPHLGEFNRTISLPEIIDATAAIAAVSISGRYLGDKRACRHL